MAKRRDFGTDTQSRRKAIGKVILKIILVLVAAFFVGYIVFCFKQG